jgi:hypothetical protein
VRGDHESRSSESLHSEDDLFLGGEPLMCVVQKSKQLDDALKVCNSLSFLEMRACFRQKRG